MALHLEQLGSLPEGFIPLRALAIVECLTPEGKREVCIRGDESAMVWDNLGLLTVAIAIEKCHANNWWEEEPGGE